MSELIQVMCVGLGLVITRHLVSQLKFHQTIPGYDIIDAWNL